VKKYIIVYATDNGDLYHEEYDTREEVDRWLDKNEDDNYKAIVVYTECTCLLNDLAVTVEYHT
jgi:hypothetical protein